MYISHLGILVVEFRKILINDGLFLFFVLLYATTTVSFHSLIDIELDFDLDLEIVASTSLELDIDLVMRQVRVLAGLDFELDFWVNLELDFDLEGWVNLELDFDSAAADVLDSRELDFDAPDINLDLCLDDLDLDRSLDDLNLEVDLCLDPSDD